MLATNAPIKNAIVFHQAGIGDIVSALVVHQALSAAGYQVHVWIPQRFQGLFSDTIYREVQDPSSQEFDLLVDLTSNSLTRKMVKKTKAKHKLGGYRRFSQWLKAWLLYDDFVHHITDAHHLVKDRYPINKKLGLGSVEIPSLQVNRPIVKSGHVVLHIGADNALRYLPMETMESLVADFQNRGITVRLVGTEQERGRELMVRTKNAPLYELGNMRQLVDWVRGARFVIGPDSGVFHLAGALGTPALGIYGPNTVARAGSLSPSVRHLENDFPCRPCNQRRCDFNQRCMQTISLNQIVVQVQDLL